MLKSPSSNGDSLFSQVPPENAANKKVTSDSSSCCNEDSSTNALDIVQTSDKPTEFLNCVKNEPVDNSSDLLLDDSLRLEIERSIDMVVNEFSLDSTSSSTSSSVASDAEMGDASSKSEKLNQCVVDSSVTNNEPEAQPPTLHSAHSDSASSITEATVSIDTSLAPTALSYTLSVPFSNRPAMSNVKCEPRDTINQSQRSNWVKNGATVSSQAPTTTSDICSNVTGVDFKPFGAPLRSSCLYSSAMRSSKEVEFALTPSVTMSSMTQPKACAAMDKMSCPASMKPSRSSHGTSYPSHSTLLDGDPQRLGSFMAQSMFPDCCNASKVNMSQSQFVSEPRYQLDSFSGCLIRKTEPSCSSSLATSSSPSLSTSCFCTSSCYGKPCSRPNQQLGNSSLSQRALNLHNSYNLYPKGVAPGAETQSFDYYRPKSSGPSCFRVPSSPISRYSVPSHLPAKEPLSPLMPPLSSYSSLSVGGDTLGSKSSFFSPTSKALKSWSGSTTTAAASAACMLPNSPVSPLYKFPSPRIPSTSVLPSGYIPSSLMNPPAFRRMADPSISAPQLYNGANASSLINASTANGLKSPQHPSVLQQYPFGSSLQKSQCCFPSQLQCYTNCCKDAQQQFSFV